MASGLGRHFCSYLYKCTLSSEIKLLLKIAELEIQSICVPGQGIKEPVYVLCCQMNEALAKIEVGPYRKYQ